MRNSTAPVGVGVIGLGFMGRTHIEAYREADRAGYKNHLVAVCDVLPDRRRGTGASPAASSSERIARFDPARVAVFSQVDELFACAEVELVSICTPTDTHVDLACQALRAGKHVLLEKPVALRSADAEKLLSVARAASSLCMPAMCMRFWPSWRWLREAIARGTYGRVVSASFQRLCPAPDWARDFYGDEARCGGALFDLHVHDADFVRWCFGDPEQVLTLGSLRHFTTAYGYRSGPSHVTAEGGWDLTSGFSFRMRFTVAFEHATADCESHRTPELVLSHRGACQAVELAAQTGYDGEVRHILQKIANGASQLDATVEEALGLTRLLEAEGRSLSSGQAVSLAASSTHGNRA